MKRLALLCGQPEEYCQELFIKGFNEVAIKAGYDVCVFAMFQKYQDSPAREIGDSSIFEMINFKAFDAVAVMCDTIQTSGVVEKIEMRLKDEYDGPVLFIEGESNQFPVILQDNYYPIKKIINHLIEDHEFTDIAFVTGKSWHPHSKKRLQAYIDSLNEHGLRVKSDRVFYGDFWYTSGETVAEKITKSGYKMPQAIACANDAMAIGLAKTLVSKGYKIPEDVVIVGYDSNEEGQHSPIPITSATLPLREFGRHCCEDLFRLIKGENITEFVSDATMFIGKSCGCDKTDIVPTYEIRKSWGTELSNEGVFSVFSHMSEDVVNATNFNGLINTIFSYIFQIRPFDSFSMCINDEWEQVKDHYTPKMTEVIRCKNVETKDSINFDGIFNLNQMIPELDEDREEPKVFYFTPLTFDDKVFGYSVVSYKDPDICINLDYRTWIRRCMCGFEFLRRADSKINSEIKAQDTLIKDRLTGLYNYNGLVERGSSILSKMHIRGGHLNVLAIDIKDLTNINTAYGRAEGDKVIMNTASFLDSVFFGSDAMCICLGNGEFVVAFITSDEGESVILKKYDAFHKRIENYNDDTKVKAKINIYYGIESGVPADVTELERLVNTAISKKNNSKIKVEKALRAGLTEEEQEQSIIVNNILDSNRINYHFQPIVTADTGEIFAYEALMRADTNPYVAPPVILQYAELSDRLYDVERATFRNVLGIVEKRRDVFDGTRKVFINSIPNQRLNDEDMKFFSTKAADLNGSIVVELTEQSELNDIELADIKKSYSRMGLETAIDDYGTGYSNISNLLRYMPGYVKIDRMLLSDIQNSPQKQHFVKDIIDFSHDNGIKTLAEGIETTDELRTVIMLGVDLIQGYYTAKPSAELVTEINPAIRKEIRETHVKYEEKSSDKLLVAGREGRINLNRLDEDKVEEIVVSNREATFNDFTVAGTPGLLTNIIMKITNNYSGRITLENIGMGINSKEGTIIIEGNSDVTLVIKGTNKLFSGIRVAPGSSLSIEGDGDLYIKSDYSDVFGIGAGSDDAHGNINIEEFSGIISIDTFGIRGCAIGSGKGGNINISNACIVLETAGRYSIGLGNFGGFSTISISDSKIKYNGSSKTGVMIGSHSGSAKVDIESSTIDASVDGHDAIFIGNLDLNLKPKIRNTKTRLSINSSYLGRFQDKITTYNFMPGSFDYDLNGNAVEA